MSVLLKLDCCPRCKGPVIIDRDYYGRYEQCLYCGYLRDIEIIAPTGWSLSALDGTEKCATEKRYAIIS